MSDMTVSEVAKNLSASRQTVIRLLKQHKFPNAYRLTNHWRIPCSDVEAFKQQAREAV
jgi:excisionase family DNA binding protein